jgi:hypothetical protein
VVLGNLWILSVPQEGLRHFILAHLGLDVDGLDWSGPECKYMIWMTRALTKRSALNPWGDCTVAKVRESNDVALVMSLKFLLP